MKMASISEAKNSLSALIDKVRKGSSILIMDRGRPVARLEPVGADVAGDRGRLEQLIRDGIVRPARAAWPQALIESPPPRAQHGASLVDALIDERRQGR